MRTTEEELRIGIVTFVVRDSLQHMWFGTQRGVYEWSDSVVAHLDNNDGLVADATRCGYVDSEGNLWIGTVGGVSCLEVRSFSQQQDPPPIHLEGLALDDQTQPGVRSSFSYDENTLTAYFNSLSFRDERRTEFQWMLAGFDAAWQAPRTERHVRYTHLPWGSYEFLVRARNGRTAWSEPVRHAFVIHPPFWGTWWFPVLSFAGVAGILLVLYRRRIRGLEKETRAEQEFSRRLMELQESERKRIAGELHDSLVQNLLVAKNRSLLGMKKTGDPERVTKELSEISSALTGAIDEVREIAHNLRPYQLDRLGLTQALQSLAKKMSESSTTLFSTDLDDIDVLFTPEMSTVLYRIVQEAVNNILKHSGASSASISARRTASGVVVTVQDNGHGFRGDTGAPSSAQGFGLSGIDQRVRMLGGTLRIDSAATTGTSMRITIPLPTNVQ
jgi:signal transduction histidine kinase